MTCHFCGNKQCTMVVETPQGDACRVCIKAAFEVVTRMAGGTTSYAEPEPAQRSAA